MQSITKYKRRKELSNGHIHEFEQFLSSQSDKKANKMWIKETQNGEICLVLEEV